MDLLYQGVVDGRISLERWVDVCCTAPARMFGLYGRKGVIAPGADAGYVGAKGHGRFVKRALSQNLI
jgi:dihydropyrimidinase